MYTASNNTFEGLHISFIDNVCVLSHVTNMITWSPQVKIGIISDFGGSEFGGGGGGEEVKTSDTQWREPGFVSSCCRFKALATSFTPHCLSSLSCINECLATDSGGYVNCCGSYLRT